MQCCNAAYGVCSVAVALPKKLEESELNVYFLEDASGFYGG